MTAIVADPHQVETLRRWITNAEDPTRARVWIPTLPAAVRQTLIDLAAQTETTLTLVEINLTTSTETRTTLWPPASSSPPLPGAPSGGLSASRV